MLGELFIGRPSSTWAIGIVWLPYLIAKPTIIGVGIGILLWSLFKLLKIAGEMPQSGTRILSIVIVVLCVPSIIAGIAKIKKIESESAPHIIYSRGDIKKLPADTHDYAIGTKAPLTWTGGSSKVNITPHIEWNGEHVTVEFNDDEHIRIVKLPKTILADTDLSSFDYVRQLYTVPFKYESKDKLGLAVLANLRASSRRSMLLIYSSDGGLIYQETLYRKRGSGESPMQLISHPDTAKDVLIVNVDSPLVYVGK
jgi:hypothetical protein